jgi:hypothetical protein
MRNKILLALSLVFSLSLMFGLKYGTAHAYNTNRVIDDSIFNNFGSMSAAQIDSFLNSFPSSCISPNNGFSAPEPTGYSPSGGYAYGSNVSAGTVIYDISRVYSINPQVLLATLQKEQSLVSGGAGCHPNTPDPNNTFQCDLWGSGNIPCTSACPYSGGCINIALGNNCPGNCQASTEGFSRQLVTSAWKLKYWQQRSEGNVSWNVQVSNFPHSGNVWDNSDDVTPGSISYCYSGLRMTQGYFRLCPNGSFATYDGLSNIRQYSGGPILTVHLDNGATAALYNWTPFVSGNQNFVTIFNNWFGTTIMPNLPGCNEATNTTRACVWNLTSPNGDEYLTSSVQSRDLLYTSQSYQYLGKAFFGNAVSLQGNIPVYRASLANQGSFITTDINEYNSVVAGGYTANGIDFYADPSWANSGYPVYRIYSPVTGRHYWTPNYQEVQSNIQSGWSYEGIAFSSISPIYQDVAPPVGKLLVYRFYIPQTYEHFWTTNLAERDNMIASGYKYEGVSWYSSSDPSKTPVYRLYAPSLNKHLYTTDLNEKNTLSSSGGWNYEGVSQYVSSSTNSAPIYRLFAPSLAVHMLTGSSSERAQLIASGGWKDEGVAWYQP